MPRIPPTHIFTAFILALTLTVSSKALKADVIYTNFGTGDAYAAGAGLIVTNDNMAWSSVAVAFTPSANYELTGIELVATDLFPDGLGAAIGIFADNVGQPGGAPIESFASGPLGQFGAAVPVLTITSLLQPVLLANTQYWIGMQAPVGDLITWNQSVTSSLGFSQTDGSGNWSTSNADQGVVEIDGTLAPDPPVIEASPAQDAPVLPPVVTQTGIIPTAPEPGALWLMLGGLAALAIQTQRSRLTNQKQ